MAQIREFESTTESYFVLDGVSYPKVYEAMLDNQYSDTKIKLVGTNRDTTPLVFSTEYTNIRVDGDDFDTASEAISRLNQVVFSKGGGSGGGGTIIQENIIRIPSATYSELGITPESTLEEKQTAIAEFLEGHVIESEDVTFFEIKEDVEPEPIFNFDVTGNWGLRSINDSASFQTELENMGFTDVVITNFSLTGNRLRASVSNTIGGSLYLNNLEITNVNIISINGLANINLSDNLIVDFNPITYLPDSLISLGLSNNKIVDFNPNISLPDSLITLDIYLNEIVDFNPTISLPNGLLYLNIYGNKIVAFNPTIPLPISLNTFTLAQNLISDWSLSEPWANSLPDGTTIIIAGSNLTSSEGTNFKSILQSKGYTVQS